MGDIKRAISDFVTQGKELCRQLRSSERDMPTDIDLYVLRAQLFLLENEAVSAQLALRQRSKEKTADDGPFDRAA